MINKQESEHQERKIYGSWEKQGLFKANPKSKKRAYSLLMPPPNLTGSLHIGHAMQHAIMDAVARFRRMQGFDVLLLPGVDHAGIQFEGTFDKELSKKGLSKKKLGREKWLELATKFKDEVYRSVHKTWRVFGISADWSREVFTLEEKVLKAVFEEFKTFWEQDLLYKGAYIVLWCPKCGTTIEDIEMEYEEKKEKLRYVKYLVKGTKNKYIIVATSRPETIFADVAIAVYPNHLQYKKFVGSKAVNPLTGLFIPIIEDARVDKNFGTGALKITPGHDLLDFEIGKDNNLEILHAIDKSGRMTNLTGKLAGLQAEKAREKTDGILDKLGALEKTQAYTHSVPICERCKATVEPLISQEWFVKMKLLADKALKSISKIHFAPKNYQKIIKTWLEDIHDWSISRSLWWGIRIPVWYCQKCNPAHEVGKDKDMIVSQDKPTKHCATCGQIHWVQDEQVLDTWFSSGLWPISTLGWPEKTVEFKKYYPWSFELSAPEIKYLWIARMIMLGLYFTDKIPFESMFFHGMLRDLQGRKFSKSLGNGIEPNELRNAWGTDAVRMTLYSYSAPGRDGRASKETMGQHCKNFRNFETKLRNITRFVIDLKPEEAKTNINYANQEDKTIIKKLDQTINDVTKNIRSFRLHLASEQLYQFIWHEFADKYIEQSKKRRAEAQPCLERVLKTSLKLLHLFMPFTSEELWAKTGEKKSIMLAKWPSPTPAL